MDLRDTFRELRPAFARLHDAPLENPGMRLVDVNLIFSNFHADADDPRNYYFEQTDDYIANCLAAGVPVFYRLGSSIEHSYKKYNVNPPEDYGKWIEIASNIIRHYTEGWANGFFYDIQYWEIWNEPDLGPKMWTGTREAFYCFYLQAARELKASFPHLKIGGPAHAEVDEEFLRFCAKHRVPLDFYSYHNYTQDPFGYITQSPAQVRALLDSLGYTETELHLNEWHYISGEDDPASIDALEDLRKGMEAGVAASLILTLWQDTPLDAAAYYTLTTSRKYGLYRHQKNIRCKSYFALKAFADLLDYPVRLQASSDRREVGVLAGRSEDGSKALLISCFKTGAIPVEINGMESVSRVLVLDDAHDLEPVAFDFKNHTLRLDTVSQSTICFVEYI